MKMTLIKLIIEFVREEVIMSNNSAVINIVNLELRLNMLTRFAFLNDITKDI